MSIPADMKINMHHMVSVILAATLLAGCATEPLPTRPLSKVALITSGGTHFSSSTSFGPDISVVEIDGKPVDRPYGPLELEPGTHSVTMKCGDSIKNLTVKASAGEVYQFAMVAAPGVKGCSGSLDRVRSARR